MVDSTQSLVNLDEKTGQPPDSRVGTAAAIRGRISEMRQNDLKRSRNRALMQGWFDGTSTPYSTPKLRATGQGDRTNFNPREAGGMSEAARSPFYSLIFRNPKFATIQTRYGQQKQLRGYWGQGMSSSFHQMLEDWEDHSYNVQFYQREMVEYGIGNTMWMDDDNWQWEAFTIGELGIPSRSASKISKLPEATRRRTISPVDLWQLIKNSDTAKTMGWFPSRVKTAIGKAAPLSLRTINDSKWSEEYQSALNRGDTDWNGTESEIVIDDYFAREFDGTITHCILAIDGGMETQDGMEDEGLLFKRKSRFKCWKQVFCPFFFDIGSKGEWDQVKGMGPKIFDNSTASARLLCDTIDGAKRAASIVLEATDATTIQQTQLPTINGATVIQPGMKATQTRIGENLEGVLAVKHELADILQNNGGPYRQRAGMENQEPTLGQAQLNYRHSEGLSEAANDRYMAPLDRQYKEMVRRALKCGVELYKRRHPDDDLEMPEEYDEGDYDTDDYRELAYWFVRRCIEDYEIPIEALDMRYICSVKATRGLGSGSPVGMDMATSQALQLYPMLSERGKKNVLRMRGTFLVGQGNVDEIVEPFEEADVPTDHEWAAVQENNTMRDPLAQLLVTPGQNHAIHFGKHYEFAAMVVKATQQGAVDPNQALMILHSDGPHMKNHLDEIAMDPGRKDQYKAMEDAWNKLSKLVDQMQQQVDAANAAKQPPKPQMDPKMAAAIMDVQGKLKIKAMDKQGQLAIKDRESKAKMARADAEAAHAMRLETLKALPAPENHPLGAAA